MVEIAKIGRSQEELKAVAGLYAEVFAGPPWNEYLYCQKDERYFGEGNELGDPCPDCSTGLVLAYPLDETTVYISKELSRDGAIGLVAKEGEELIGFSWCYIYQNPEEFGESKYKTPEMRQTVKDLLTDNGIEKFYYFSETGLKKEFRGRGLSKLFYGIRLDMVKETGLPVVVRTMYTTPIIVVAPEFGFQQIMGPEVIIDKVKRTATKTGRLINGIQDSENENRVLFAYLLQ